MKRNSVFKNYIYNAAYSLLNVIIPIITIPYVSRILLAEGVGKISYAQNIVSYFVLFASLGIPNYGVREIARDSQNAERRSQTFFEIFTINAIATILSSIAYYFAILNFDFFSDKKELYIIVGIPLLLNVFKIDWFYKGLEEFRYIAMRSYFVKIASLVAIFVFVHNPGDTWIYALISSLSVTVNYIFNVVHVRKYIVFSPKKMNLRKHLNAIVFMFATAVAVELYSQLDTTMVGAICGDSYVGYYSNAMKLTKIIVTVITALGGVLLPRLSVIYREGDKDKFNIMVSKAVEYIILIAIPSALGLFLVSDSIVRVLFGVDFLPSIVTLKILVFLIPIMSIGNIFGTQLMIVLNKERQLTLTVIAGALVNITFNYFLIPKFQQNGAAVASVVAELVVMIAQIIMTKENVSVSMTRGYVYKILIQSIAMTITVLAINTLEITSIVKLILAISFGGLAYVISGILLKNNLEMEVVSRLFHKNI